MNNNLRILIIEDNPGDFILIKSYIRDDLGDHIEFVIASSLDDGINKANESDFDVALIDLGLPDSSGLDTIRLFKENTDDSIAIIVLTGFLEPDVDLLSVGLGAQDFIPKRDLSKNGLLRRSIQNAISRKRLELVNRIYTNCLTLLSSKHSLDEVFKELMLHLDKLYSHIRSSFMIVSDDGGTLKIIAAPNLSKNWIRRIDFAKISEKSRTCGLAAFKKDSIFVPSINDVSNWSEDLVSCALKENIHACWAEPVVSSNDDVLGVFMFFIDREGEPGIEEKYVINQLKRMAITIINSYRLEQQRDHANAKFKSLFDKSTDCILLHDSEFSICEVNDTVIEVYGHPREDLIGKHISILRMGPEGVGDSVLYLNKLKSGGTINFETIHKNKSGESFPVEVRSKIIPINGDFMFLQISRNISHVKSMERTLRHTNDVLKALRQINRLSLLESDPKAFVKKAAKVLIKFGGYYHAWIVLTDSDGNFIYSTEKSRYREKYLSKTIDTLDELPNCMRTAIEGDSMFCADEPVDRCYKCPVKNQNIEHGAFSIPLVHNEKHFGVISVGLDPQYSRKFEEQEFFEEIANDISYTLFHFNQERELADSESKYRLLADNSSDCIWLASLSHAIVYVNPAVESITGYREDEVVGHVIGVDFAKDHYDLLNQYLNDLLKHKDPKPIEITIKHKDGYRIPCEIIANVLLDKEGNSTAFQGSMRSIEDRKKAEEEIIAAKNDAVRANAAKDEFLAIMSHEMRTPLNPIIGFSSLMLESNEFNEENRSFLEAIHESAVRELDLVDNILSFNKIRNGKVNILNTIFNIQKVIDDAIVEKKPNASDVIVSISIQDVGDGETGQWNYDVKGPKNLISQVLSKLIENAFKYTEKGHVDIRVEVTQSPEGDGLFKFSIQDSGVGIDEDRLESIFDPFNQADNSFSREYSGAGLGLAICRRIVELIGGDIGVESKLNEGSLFWFSVPLELCSKRVSAYDSDVDDRMFTHLKALIIEDQSSNYFILTTLLERYGVLTVLDTGSQCLSILKREKIDLVIIDLSLPDVDGIELARAIRASSDIHQNIPIFAISDDVSSHMKDQCRSIGMNGFIEKPIQQEIVQEILLEVDRINLKEDS